MWIVATAAVTGICIGLIAGSIATLALVGYVAHRASKAREKSMAKVSEQMERMFGGGPSRSMEQAVTH
jgi:hypothetical protein